MTSQKKQRLRGARRHRIAAVCGLLVLGGCVRYQPQPLPVAPIVASAALPVAFETTRKGLDAVQVAILAVANNPALRAARTKRGVASAQVFAAGLLPDPQLSLSGDTPSNNDPALVDAYGVSLSYDVQALITHGAKREQAQAGAAQVDLDLLWQEWQVLQQAQLLYVQNQAVTTKLGLQQKVRDLFAERYQHSARALKEGNLTLDVAGADLTAVLDATSQFQQLARAQDQMRHDLNAVLGLAPDVVLALGPPLPLSALDTRALAAIVTDVATRRPDLLALQAGYRSQVAALHAAVLAQFPSLSVGFTRARDTGNVQTSGLGITLNLPVFSRNRGEIARETATRAQLLAEYQARLDETGAAIDRLRSEAHLLDAAQSDLQALLPELRRIAAAGRGAYAAGKIAALVYLNFETSLLTRELEAVDLAERRAEIEVGINALLAKPLTSATRAPEKLP